MATPRIYSAQPLTLGQLIQLDAAAARHVGLVLRMKAGQPLTLFNGDGGCFSATIKESSKRSVTVSIDTFHPDEKESPLKVHLAQSISKGDRMEYAIQKATELGITEITPIYTEHGDVRLKGDRAGKKQQHWQQVAISACEQCQRNRVPVVHPAVSLQEWLEEVQADLKLVLHHRTERQLSGYDKPERVALLIGPEGGLSASEIEQAQQQNFKPLALGPRVLRTETAPVVALSVLQYNWGDF
jgi:16S rRNA (uracil1498-N3)-methyltransferase